MRSIICVSGLVAMIVLAGCGQQDATPTTDPVAHDEKQTDQGPISEEDFESGEAKDAVQSGADDQGSNEPEDGETP